MQIRRGEIYMARLEGYEKSSVQAGYRPVLVMSNNIGNRESDIVCVLPISTKIKNLPINVDIHLNGMQYSQVLTNQMRTIPKRELNSYVAFVGEEKMLEIEEALLFSLGISKAVTKSIKDSAEQLSTAQQDLKELKEKIPQAKQLMTELKSLLDRYKEVTGRKSSNGEKSSIRYRRTPEELKELVRRFYVYKEPKEDLIRDFDFNTPGAFYQCVSSAKKKYPEALK